MSRTYDRRGQGQRARGLSRELEVVVLTIFLVIAPGAFSSLACAQIGGRTSADGIFVLDDFEDLDTTASGVLRAWIPETQGGTTFQVAEASTGGLTLASGQTTAGAVCYKMKTSNGYISKSFGVPMPAVAGASTATNPGNITSFSRLSFFIRSSTSLTSQSFSIILETYPGPTYPRIYWKYQVPPGVAYQRVTLDLRAPSLIENAGGRTLEELLAETRYLAFYFYAGPEPLSRSWTVNVDDIWLEPSPGPNACVSEWGLYE